jgi:ATP-dependent Clp protease ATP-binding subunit ClpC
LNSIHYPVLIWADPAGRHTAALVNDDQHTAAVGDSPDDALRQLKEYLDWSWTETPWQSLPDFHQPELLEAKIDVRPEYEHENHPYPCAETVRLRVPFVRGQQESGLGLCSIPTLGLHFTFSNPETLPGLVAHYVKTALKSSTPRQLATCLPPTACTLETLVIRIRDTPSRATAFNPARSTPTLAAVAEPLTAPGGLRTQLGPAWERDREVAALVQRLESTHPSVLIIGNPGTGKTTVLLAAARALARSSSDDDNDNRDTRNHRFWLTSAARLVAGMKYIGQWEDRCQHVIEELAELNGVLCLENLLDAVRTGGQAPIASVAAFLIPYLQRGELRLVAEATPGEADACRRLLPGFVESLQILNLEPLAPDATIRTLEKTAQSSAQSHTFTIDPAVPPEVSSLFRRFQPYAPFPGAPVRFLRDLLGRADKDHAPTLAVPQVRTRFIETTGLPEAFLDPNHTLEHTAVLNWFQTRIIAQPDACRAAATLVTTFKAGLNDPRRPLGVLLFCGPTGVGKTALARALADYLFGHGTAANRLVRIDLSEFAVPGSAERLVRSPDGGPSPFIQQLRRHPFSVVLLDEIEKADPEIFDLLLNVFDEGRLADPFGRITYFRSAAIILTSNLGAARNTSLGFNPQTDPAFDHAVAQFFRPEFYNRLDTVVAFKPLDESAILAITRKELAEIAQREGLARAHIKLQFSDPLVQFIATTGFDRRYGARPLQRAIDRLIVAPLARYLLHHPAPPNTTLQADLDGSQIVFCQRDGGLLG